MITDEEWERFTRELEETHTRWAEESRDLVNLIKQRRVECGNLIPVLSFYARGYKGIAIVQDLGNLFRITRFTDIGPMGHSDFKNLEGLADELREIGYIPVDDPNAGQLVEYWAKQSRWADGIIGMQLTAIGNTLRFKGEYDKAREVEVKRDTRLGYRYCRELGINPF